MEEHPDAPFKIAAIDYDTTSVAIPMRKGDDSASLREAVNKALEKLREEGVLKVLSEKYFGGDITENIN